MTLPKRGTWIVVEMEGYCYSDRPGTICAVLKDCDEDTARIYRNSIGSIYTHWIFAVDCVGRSMVSSGIDRSMLLPGAELLATGVEVKRVVSPPAAMVYADLLIALERL